MTEIKHYITAAARVFGVDPEAITEVAQHGLAHKTRELSKARNVAMFMARRNTEQSFPIIGKIFNSHHTTVVRACQRVSKTPELMQVTEAIMSDMEFERAQAVHERDMESGRDPFGFIKSSRERREQAREEREEWKEDEREREQE